MINLPNSLHSLKYSDQGNFILGLSRDPIRYVFIWESENLKLFTIIALPTLLDEISFFQLFENLGEVAVGTYCGHMLIFDLGGYLDRMVYVFPEENIEIKDISYSEFHKCGFVVGALNEDTGDEFGSTYFESRVHSFNWETLEITSELPASRNEDVGKIYFVDNGKTLVTCPSGIGYDVKFWDVGNENPINRITLSGTKILSVVEISQYLKTSQDAQGEEIGVKVRDFIFDQNTKRAIIGSNNGLSIWELNENSPAKILGSTISKTTFRTRLRSDGTIVVINRDLVTEYSDGLNDFTIFLKALDNMYDISSSPEEKISAILEVYSNHGNYYEENLELRTYDNDGKLLSDKVIFSNDLTEYVFGAKRVQGQFPPNFSADISPDGTKLALFDQGIINRFEINSIS